MANEYQMVGFHFRVKFLNLPEDKEADVKFQSDYRPGRSIGKGNHKGRR